MDSAHGDPVSVPSVRGGVRPHWQLRRAPVPEISGGGPDTRNLATPVPLLRKRMRCWVARTLGEMLVPDWRSLHPAWRGRPIDGCILHDEVGLQIENLLDFGRFSRKWLISNDPTFE